MNDVGGSESGSGLRAAKPSRPSESNFEYDDSEWDVGIGNLIIDLDADIEKNKDEECNEGGKEPLSPTHMHIPHPSSGSGKKTAGAKPDPPPLLSAMDHTAVVDKGLKMKIKRTKTGTKSADAKHEIVKTELGAKPNKEGSKDPPAKDSAAKEKDGEGTASGGGKVKPAKRGGSSHKKVKNPAGTAAVKKEVEGKGKTETIFPSTLSVTPNAGGSAFAKTSTATLKVPPIGGTGDLMLNSSGRVYGTIGSLAASPGKGDKGRLSPSVEKSGYSGKKARVYAPPADKEDPPGFGRAQHQPSSTTNPSIDLPLSSPNSTSLLAGSTGLVLNSFNNKEKSRGGGGLSQDVCVGTSVGTVTEPDCLGPCEPGTSVTLEGIVWHETESGVLVVNVTWRGKTYVGTLLDCTKNDWAPPRFCDSPTSDLEMRTPKNRGKRGRANAPTPVSSDSCPISTEPRSANTKLRNGAKGRRGSGINNSTSAFVTPISPMKPEPWPKRKTRGSETESIEDSPLPSTNAPKSAKRPKVSGKDKEGRSSSSPLPEEGRPCPSPALIECPEPNCSKKYKHINGLKYHQSHSHAHSNSFNPGGEDSDSNMSSTSTNNLNSLPAGETEETPPDPLPMDVSEESPKKKEVEGEKSPPLTPSNKKEDCVSRPPILTVPVPFGRGSSFHPREEPLSLKGTSKGPWTPHSSPHGMIPGGSFVSSIQSSPLPLTIPSIVQQSVNKDDKKEKSPDKNGKKTKHKHKKANKEKERDKGHSGKSGFSLPIPERGKEDGKEEKVENRDDPQSPAYSDISDANESGPESDPVGTSLKKNCSKTLVVPSTPEPLNVHKKDSSGHISNYYPTSFYSPYNLDSGSKGSEGRPSAPTNPPTAPPQPEDSPTIPIVPPISEGKSSKGGNGKCDERRSPKIDFHHQKYQQPHYFYPYSNYHFDSPGYGGGSHGGPGIPPPEGFSPRSYPEDKSGEKGKEGREPEVDNPLIMNIKQEPGLEKKEGEKEEVPFPSPLGPPEGSKSKGHHSSSSFFTCNKHSKEGGKHKETLVLPERENREKESGKRSEKSRHSHEAPSDNHSSEKESEKSDKGKNEGSKPTMETTGPPPPPTAGNYAYISQSFLQSSPFGLPFEATHPSLYRQVLVPNPYSSPSPYGLHHPGPLPRYPPPGGVTPLPEDLSGRGGGGGGGGAKALDLLQHHAAQYYASHKIHELQERALKSPSPQVGRDVREPAERGPIGGKPSSPATLPTGNSNRGSSGGRDVKPADLSGKETKPLLITASGGSSDSSSRSPPTQHHVHSHTHHHTHVGIGYPILPTVPPQYSPHYGVLAPTPTAAVGASVIPPYSSQKPN